MPEYPWERWAGFTLIPARERRAGYTRVSPPLRKLHPQPSLPIPLHNVPSSPRTYTLPHITDFSLYRSDVVEDELDAAQEQLK